VNKSYSHYFKKCGHEHVDVYRVLLMFEVTDPCIQHAVKKLLVCGNRGHKDQHKDIVEAIVSLQRWIEMRTEEQPLEVADVTAVPDNVVSPVGIAGTPTRAP
jgi:hypothetical protein